MKNQINHRLSLSGPGIKQGVIRHGLAGEEAMAFPQTVGRARHLQGCWTNQPSRRVNEVLSTHYRRPELQRYSSTASNTDSGSTTGLADLSSQYQTPAANTAPNTSTATTLGQVRGR